MEWIIIDIQSRAVDYKEPLHKPLATRQPALWETVLQQYCLACILANITFSYIYVRPSPFFLFSIKGIFWFWVSWSRQKRMPKIPEESWNWQCAVQIISILPLQKGLEFPVGWGILEDQKFKEVYWSFTGISRGVEGVGGNPFHGGRANKWTNEQ